VRSNLANTPNIARWDSLERVWSAMGTGARAADGTWATAAVHALQYYSLGERLYA